MKDFCLTILKNIIITKTILFILLIIIGVSSRYIWGDNNLLEEITEMFVKEETGLDIDFSSTEKQNIKKDLEQYKHYRP